MLCLPRTGMSSPQHPPMLPPRIGWTVDTAPGLCFIMTTGLGPAEVRPATDGGSSGRVATYLLSPVLCCAILSVLTLYSQWKHELLKT